MKKLTLLYYNNWRASCESFVCSDRSDRSDSSGSSDNSDSSDQTTVYWLTFLKNKNEYEHYLPKTYSTNTNMNIILDILCHKYE